MQWRDWIPRGVGYLMALLVLATIVIGIFWSSIAPFAREYDSALKVFSLLFGVLATILGFALGLESKKELVEQSQGAQHKLITLSERLNAQIIARSHEAGELGERVRQADRELTAKADALQAAHVLIAEREARIAYQSDQISKLAKGSSDLWYLRGPKPFPEYQAWMRAPDGAKIIAIGNQKGGVGKTTLAANLAAYIDVELRKPVLAIDLDFQGSLSSMLLTAAEIVDVESRVERLFAIDASLGTVSANRHHLANKLNRGWIVPANYTFAGQENELMFQYVMDDTGEIDMRYRLAHTLLQPEVRREYAAIIIDMPPRLSIASINALFASHSFVVPTVLDKLSGESVHRFIAQARVLKNKFGLDLDLAGVVGTMTRHDDHLTDAENGVWEIVAEGAEVWRPGADFRIGTIQRRAAIANAMGEDIAYVQTGQNGTIAKQLLEPALRRICEQTGLINK